MKGGIFLPRQFRTLSSSKIYHIIFKGIDDTNIFYTSEDKSTFLEKIKLSKKEFPFKIYAYCLMNNHVHLIIESESNMLSKSMKSLLIRYVYYFNKTYQRKGPLFQNRFYSKNVENQDYFLSVCRYVHRNPEKAGIAKTFEYDWSSYKEYLNKEKIIDKHVLLYYLDNNLDNFISYTNKPENKTELLNLADFELIPHLSDEAVINIIQEKYNLTSLTEIISFFKQVENKYTLKDFKNINGITKNQLSRIIRVDRKTITKIWNND